jgi:hypothetical protein
MPEEGFSASSIYFSMILLWKGEMYIVKHNMDFFFLTKHGMEVLWCRIFVHGMLSMYHQESPPPKNVSSRASCCKDDVKLNLFCQQLD